jgi:hypothetical protein
MYNVEHFQSTNIWLEEHKFSEANSAFIIKQEYENAVYSKYYIFGHYTPSCIYLKRNVSETGFRLHLQVEPTQLGPRENEDRTYYSKICVLNKKNTVI